MGNAITDYVPHKLPNESASVLSVICSVPTERGTIRSAYNLQAPDAIVIPTTSFQFGFVESFCFFALAFFFFCNKIKVWDVTSPFTYTYFEKLFSSLILINAP